MQRRREAGNLAASMLIGLVILLALIGLVLFFPQFKPGIDVPASPTKSYAEAMERAEEVRSQEAGEPLRPDGMTVVLSHGEMTDDVFVLLHGLTNSPRQFRELGELLFARGANVVIPRMPHHGLADRMNTEHGQLTAADLVFQAQTGLDIATGLGRRVTLVGLSVSGVSAAWIAQNRPDADTVFLLAPFLGSKLVPDFLTGTAARALSRLPNGFVWWDGKNQEDLGGSDAVYPRFATRQIAETLRLSGEVAGNKDPLQARKLAVILTDADRAVNNQRTLRVLENWKVSSPDTEFFLHTFPAEEDVPHDFIDPEQPDAQTDRLYPILLEWLHPK